MKTLLTGRKSRVKLVAAALIACTLIVGVLLSGSPALADFVVYNVPGTGMALVLQGKATSNPGKTISFKHAQFGNLFFSLDTVKIHEVPTIAADFNKRLGQATRKKNAEEVFKAAQWGLRHGLLKEFYSAVDKTLELHPSHPEALRIVALKREIEKEIPDSPELENELRKFGNKPDMKIMKSKHFILLYDTPEVAEEGKKKKNRAQKRIELLEQVYESFLLTFFSRGIELEVPKQRLKVILFNNFGDFKSFALRLSPTLTSVAGFWTHEENVSVFFDHGSYDQIKELKDASAKMDTQIKDLQRTKPPGAGKTIQLLKTLQLIIKIAQESQDIEVVSHEATHQMAGNTGLFPRQVRVPSWVHEGLAAYFEAPSDATWSGIGAVNETRLDYYRALAANDRVHSNIDFIVGDQIFDLAATNGSTLHGYGQAWALTHFLMEKRFDDLMKYYRKLGEMPPDILLSPDMLTTLFNDVFSEERAALDSDWRTYMDDLKTDVELVLGEKVETRRSSGGSQGAMPGGGGLTGGPGGVGPGGVGPSGVGPGGVGAPGGVGPSGRPGGLGGPGAPGGSGR